MVVDNITNVSSEITSKIYIYKSTKKKLFFKLKINFS